MSNKPKHTPGPWNADKATYHNGYIEYFVRRDGDAVAITGDITDPETKQPSEANAQLIAAAPDLLEALKWIMSECRVFCQDSMDIDDGAVYSAREAIAKAEGRGE